MRTPLGCTIGIDTGICKQVSKVSHLVSCHSRDRGRYLPLMKGIPMKERIREILRRKKPEALKFFATIMGLYEGSVA
jgi:hypothetical protein